MPHMKGWVGNAGRQGVFAATLMATTILGCTAAAIPAMAQSAEPSAAQAASRDFDIPAQPVADALILFGTQAGLQASADIDIVRGLRSAPVKGQMSWRQALNALLAGTGLSYRLNGSMVTVEKLPASGENGTLQLDPVQVDGGSGGVIQAVGYVGLSSATGAKTDTPFTETPQSVSSVTAQQIEDRNPQSLLEAIAYTPGVRVNAYGVDPRYDSFFVRGFNVTNTGVFRDNLRQPVSGYGYFLTEPYGIEGISILRGPSSALYGGTGAGGLYNVITKRPTETPYHDMQLQFGSHDRTQGQFDLSGPVAENSTVFYRLTGLKREGDTEFQAVSDDRTYIAPAVMWRPNKDTKLTLLAEYSESDTGGNPAYYNDRTGHVTRIESGDPAFSELDHDMARIGWEFEHTFNDTFTARQNFRYSTQDATSKYVYTYNGTAHTADPSMVDRGTGYEVQDMDSVAVDNQLETRVETGPLHHTVLTGLDVTWAKFRNLTGYGTADPLNLNALNYGGAIATPALTARTEQTQWQTGLYLQDQIRYDSWTLTLGGRHDWVSTDTDDTDLTSGAVTSTSQEDRKFSGRAGLTYQTDFGLVPYASISTAFSPNVGISKVTNSPFKPTTSTQQEIGVKYLFPNANAMLSAALFNIDQNQGLFYEVVNGVNTQVQRGKLRSRGFELEASASLDNGLSLVGAYSYTDLKTLVGPPETVDNNVSSVPRHTASLWTDYKLPESSPLFGLSGGPGIRFTSASYGNDANTIRNDSRTYLDGAVRYDLGAISPQYQGLSLRLNATNVLDRRETTCTSGYCYFDPGRTVIGSIRYTW